MKERQSVDAAREYAENALTLVPQSCRWRVTLDLADLAKRSNDFQKARSLYDEVCKARPRGWQGWLEWSKMEEECGQLYASLDILRRGLRECEFNEGLLTKAIKQLERLHDVKEARHMLSRTNPKYESIDRVWKAILEGALLEARAGKTETARHFFSYLMKNVPWYGPIYFEAFRLEEKSENFDKAMSVVTKGLNELPRYGPLWFGLLSLLERIDGQEERHRWFSGQKPLLKRVRVAVDKAGRFISRELVWKVHFELAQIEERAVEIAAVGMRRTRGISVSDARHELLSSARLSYTHALLACPDNLRWKVWLASARMELSANRLAVCRQILCHAFKEVPDKSRSHVYLEASRVEEFVGNLRGARRVLHKARMHMQSEWKVFLETVLLEARAGNIIGAIEAADSALEFHSGTGRLWAILIQLCHRVEWVSKSEGEEGEAARVKWGPFSGHSISQHSALVRALREVPKSGEVWCEGARAHLNPLFAGKFDLARAMRYLSFAAQFTPQYGDTFIEYLRLELISQVILPLVLRCLGIPYAPFIRTLIAASGNPETDTAAIVEDESKTAEADGFRDFLSDPLSSEERRANIISINNLDLDPGRGFHDIQPELEALTLKCMNADPNYGTLWFFCRQQPCDTARGVLHSARQALIHDLLISQRIYMRAVLLYTRIALQEAHANSFSASDDGDWSHLSGHISIVEEVLKDFHWVKESEGAFVESCPIIRCHGDIFASADFMSALIEQNRSIFNRSLTDEERRAVLFNSSQIIP